MNRREAITVGGVGVAGLFLPQKTEGVPISHELLDRGLSHEEMARCILGRNDVCILRKADSRICTIYPQYTTPEHNGGFSRQVHVVGSIITMVTFEHLDGRTICHERFDISDPRMRTIQIAWGDEYFGRMGERWFQLGA